MNMKAAIRWCIFLFLALFVFPRLSYGEVYLSKQEALDLVLGKDCEQKEERHQLSADILQQLEDRNLSANPKSDVSFFFVCYRQQIPTGYALIDEQVGKHMPITYIVGINPAGTVTRVEMMVFREVRGWETRSRTFMSQFESKSTSDDLNIGSGIRNVSGATLSSRAIAKGVQRALFLWQTFYGPKK